MPTLVRGIDVSSHQASDLSALIGEHTPKHIVVRLYLPDETPPQAHTKAQIASARATGCTVGGYVWCYFEFDPRKTVRDAIALARSANLDLPVLWLDCETYENRDGSIDRGPDAPWLRAAIAECRALGIRPGIYTAGWWWRDFMGNTTEFADVPLWAADYNGTPDIEDVRMFGGWTKASGKQWAERLPSGAGLDQNVFRDDVTGDGPLVVTPTAPSVPARGQAERLTTMLYNPDTPTVRQTGAWQCSAASSAWVLQSVGITWGQDDVVRWLGPNINSDSGLQEASGRMLAALFRSHGLDAGFGPILWDEAVERAGRQPFCLGGMGWNHWSAVRGTDGARLLLANPAPNWQGVGQEMDRGEWDALGNWNAAWVNVSTTLDQLEAASPGISQAILEWQRARYRNREDPNDFAACRTHLMAIGKPDPGRDEPEGFHRPTIGELEATQPGIRQQIAEWQAARRRNGEDPNDYPACRKHLRALGAPDPGPVEILGFAD